MAPRILFISNGHGEDLNASLIIQALLRAHPELEVAAMPIVGDGHAYRRIPVPVIVPTQAMPSGGIFYMSKLALLQDLLAGLPRLIWRQIRSATTLGKTYDLVMAVGDVVPVGFARLTGRPYCSFIVSTSSYYEGQLRLPWPMGRWLRSSRCQHVFTRDSFTAKDLHQQGMAKARFSGYPIMDTLLPKGHPLDLDPALPMLALLPGSRLPEARHNLVLQLQLCRRLLARQPMQMRAALVPSFTDSDLQLAAKESGWTYQDATTLTITNAPPLRCYKQAFADILHQCDLAIGMAGTAVEQAVGLGKPVIQIPGSGPQFTYPFAEAQMRLLGSSVQTIGTKPATSETLDKAADAVISTLNNRDYQHTCPVNGQERVGAPGGSAQIAEALYQVAQSLGLL